jgi:hypothetical protein
VPAETRLETRPHRDVPARPRGADPARVHGLETLFGDIHQHSAHSDGCGAAAEPYLRARHVYGDDFAALSDHESFLGKRIGPGEWSLLRAVADRFDEPGSFVALHAYEWTGRMHPGPGHKVVYPVSPAHRVVSRDTEPTRPRTTRRSSPSGRSAAATAATSARVTCSGSAARSSIR